MLSGGELVFGRLMAGLAAHGDRTALLCDGQPTSYAELTETSNRLANALLGLGIEPGQRVAFGLPNGAEIVECYLACASTGLVGVPLAARLSDEELRFELRDSGAVAVLATPAYADRVDALRDDLPALRHVIDTAALGSLLASAATAPPDADPRPEDPFCVMYTGGTTGTAKAALQTQASWAACVDTVVDVWRLWPGDRHVIVLPMTHVAWFTAAAHLYAGATTTVMPRWDPEAVLRTVTEQASTTLNMIPTMLGDLLGAVERAGPAAELGSVRLLTVAGSSMPLEMYRRARDTFGAIIGNIYGMTETSGPVTYLLPEHMRDETILSGGRPGTYVELAVLDAGNRPVGGNERGEIGLRGPQVTAGYLGQDDETAEAFAGGWFHTGDIGYVDADGFVYVVDRLKDMIKTGGFNVYPKEIEEVLYLHADVIEAAVIGLPDPRWIEAVHAIVVLRRGSSATAEEIAGHCRAHLAAHKVPKAVHFSDGLPRTGVGKFDKRELRRAYAPERALALAQEGTGTP